MARVAGEEREGKNDVIIKNNHKSKNKKKKMQHF